MGFARSIAMFSRRLSHNMPDGALFLECVRQDCLARLWQPRVAPRRFAVFVPSVFFGPKMASGLAKQEKCVFPLAEGSGSHGITGVRFAFHHAVNMYLRHCNCCGGVCGGWPPCLLLSIWISCAIFDRRQPPKRQASTCTRPVMVMS